nr:hypothetical protein Iba_chr04eCG6510 [Ipomoea batatas]
MDQLTSDNLVPKFFKATAMLVDDSSIDRKLIERLLVSLVSSPAEAEEQRLRRKRPAVEFRLDQFLRCHPHRKNQRQESFNQPVAGCGDDVSVEAARECSLSAVVASSPPVSDGAWGGSSRTFFLLLALSYSGDGIECFGVA